MEFVQRSASQAGVRGAAASRDWRRRERGKHELSFLASFPPLLLTEPLRIVLNYPPRSRREFRRVAPSPSFLSLPCCADNSSFCILAFVSLHSPPCRRLSTRYVFPFYSSPPAPLPHTCPDHPKKVIPANSRAPLWVDQDSPQEECQEGNSVLFDGVRCQRNWYASTMDLLWPIGN